MALKTKKEHTHRGLCAGSSLGAAASSLAPRVSAEVPGLPQYDSLNTAEQGVVGGWSKGLPGS